MVSVAFLWSGLFKLWNPVGFAAAVAGYRLTGPWGTLLVAAILPAIEIVCAIGLWVPRWRRTVLSVLLGACVVFLVALCQAWARGLDIRCGCFGDHGKPAQYPYWIARDLVFLATLAWLARRGSACSAWSVDRVNAGFQAAASAGCGLERAGVFLGVREAAILLFVAAVFGLGVDAVRPRGVFWQEVWGRREESHGVMIGQASATAGTTLASAELSEVNLEQVRRLVDSGSALIVDARPRVFWRLGHLPGAVSVPHDDLDRGFAEFRSRSAVHPGKPVIVYCEGDPCHDGRTVANALIARGMTEVRLFTGGWDAWEAAGLPTEADQ